MYQRAILCRVLFRSLLISTMYVWAGEGGRGGGWRGGTEAGEGGNGKKRREGDMTGKNLVPVRYIAERISPVLVVLRGLSLQI